MSQCARISARDCPRGLVWAGTTRSCWATLPFCNHLPGKPEMLVAASARSVALEVQRVPLPRAWRGPRSRCRRGATEFEVRVAQARGCTKTCKHVKKPAQLPHQRRRTSTQKNAMAAIIMLAFLYSRLAFRDCKIAIASSVAAAPFDKRPPPSAGAPRCTTTKKRRRHFNSRGLIQGLPRRAAELDRACATRCPRRCLLIDVVRRRRVSHRSVPPQVRAVVQALDVHRHVAPATTC